MLTKRPANERGHADHGWLNAYHTFSFADYVDRQHMGFRVLRVINEDRVQGGMGFATHGHRDMEIVTYVIEGELRHKDTMGNTEVIRPGEVQYMSAGTGVQHSEFNAHPKNLVHLLQIWILPDKSGYSPTYGQKSFLEALNQNNRVLAVSPDGREGSIAVRQDVYLYVNRLQKGQALEQVRQEGRYGWLQMVKGQLRVNDEILSSSDGLAISNEARLRVQAEADTEFLFFDLP
jgi:redox-sensitive bicupin YhaK (pirin superfamily)